jgi:pentatricopeptide repeat-containing protein PET309
MLERATACVEPSINVFFRRIENPTRTNRVLHPSFWRNTAENRSTPAWWPAYLHDIRDVPLGQSRARPTPPTLPRLVNDDIHAIQYMKLSSARQKQRTDISTGSRYPQPSLRSGRRTFSLSHGKRDGNHEESPTGEKAEDMRPHIDSMDGDDVTVRDAEYAHHRSSIDAASYTGGPVNIPFAEASEKPEAQLPPEESLRTLLDSDDPDAYGKAWQRFIRVGDQGKLAGDMLEYLSTSDQRIDLDHAIRAYRLIPPVDRSLSHYQAAIKAACRRKQHKLAVEIHHDANKRGFHTKTTSTLLGFLIRHRLWKTAAQVWDRLPISQKNAADPRNRHLWVETDQHTTLPGKLLSLMRRLEQEAAVFASEREHMFGLGVQLLYRVFSSSEIMAGITGSGTLALLDKFYSMGVLNPHHYWSGIQTLNKMKDSRNRHQLATLLYRNMAMRFPHVRLPRSVLGSLIAILCESDSNQLASRVVLRRYARDWVMPDKQAYQKVLTACAQNGDPLNAHAVFAEYCSDYGKPVDIAYITPLLYVYARLGNVPDTQKQFDRLKSEFGIVPNAYCWNILITAHARARDREGAFDVARDMRRAGINPDQHTYGTLMGICAMSGDTEAVYQLVETARQQHISGTTAMIDSLIHSYCLNDQVEDAESLVEAATQMHLKGSPTRMWNTLLRHYAFRADTDAVLRTQERMKELSVAADGMTYAALMQSLINIGQTNDAANILRSLHFSNVVTATVFHYSIVLYGYASENNRDMVSVIYNEMLERFPRTGLSAKLSRLRSHVYRDTILSQSRLKQAIQGKPMNKGLRLSKTLDFLARVLLDVNQSDLATKDPQPGLGRRSPIEAFPSVYLEFLVAAFGRSGALERAENLLGKYQALMDSANPMTSNDVPSIQLLTAIMITLVQQKRFATVHQCWNKALSLAIEKGRQKSLDLSDPIAETDTAPRSDLRPDAPGISFQTSIEASGNQLGNPFLERGNVRILAAHRYSLAAPLTQYMYCLSAQNLAANLPPLVRMLEELGFSLTSKNWNHYIQVLSYSNDAELQVLAFRTFEEKLLQNMPPWYRMKRSKWSKRQIVDGSGDVVIQEPVQRTFVERFHPHDSVPTYWTMVYLGLALMKAQQRGVKGEQSGLSLLRTRAPGTLSAVSRMPYLREKAQGLLLRGRTLRGDPQKRPRRAPEANRAGLRGSRSPLDHIPLDFPHHEIERTLKPNQVPPFRQPKVEQRTLVQTAEQLVGEIQRSPLVLEAAGRYEDEPEYLRRLRAEEQEKLSLIVQMREDAAQSRLMADDKHGEPFLEANLEDQQSSLPVDNMTESQSKEKEELLSTALDLLGNKGQEIRHSPSSNQPSDLRPAAILSAARRPKAAERLHLLRLQRRRRPAIKLSSAAFRRSLGKKITAALITDQPRLRIPNRLRRAFTRNRAARRMRTRARMLRRSRSERVKRSGQDATSSNIGLSEEIESEYPTSR